MNKWKSISFRMCKHIPIKILDENSILRFIVIKNIIYFIWFVFNSSRIFLSRDLYFLCFSSSRKNVNICCEFCSTRTGTILLYLVANQFDWFPFWDFQFNVPIANFLYFFFVYASLLKIVTSKFSVVKIRKQAIDLIKSDLFLTHCLFY